MTQWNEWARMTVVANDLLVDCMAFAAPFCGWTPQSAPHWHHFVVVFASSRDAAIGGKCQLVYPEVPAMLLAGADH